ncbi:MAG TPA: DUF5682 family protein [Trebonia sp.]|nr:DUF5682 family protein [Trebonia sp.]
MSDREPRVTVLGVRHHGPGSARSVLAELDRIKPAIVLIEGPADADPVLGLAAVPGMTPPVALLGYAPDEPRISAFWPFAVFSPEWQALTWAHARGVRVRFCDLPAGMVLARGEEEEEHGESRNARSEEKELISDPIGRLAAAAGYDDPERWWDDLIESRVDGGSPFDALADALGELREGAPEEPLRERRREAHMRQAVRAALKEADGPVAIVCGAWHAPALREPLPPAAKDAALLRGIPKRKAALAWVPWTHSRLAAASGYGAGITSPGWYHHLFTTREQTVIRWMTRVAGVLRAHDLPVSSSHVIEAVRLAEALAVLRGRPLAGLAEVSEATKAVMCDGDEVAAAFVTRDLVVGELLGSVPDSAPPVPLDADVRGQAKTLRLKIDPLERTLALDLRRTGDRARSVFLHRLGVLGIGWGEVTDDLVRGTGTFHETWSLRWRPELSVAIIDAAVWGTTVAGAASARIVSLAESADRLSVVTGAVVQVLLASLEEALDPVLRALDSRAAADADVVSLMTAVPSLVRAVRYGDVRGTPTQSLSAVVDALCVRICAGLPAAAGGLADDAATRLRDAMDGLHGALAVHAQSAQGGSTREAWLAVLGTLAERRDVHGLVAGRVTRMLADAGVLTWPVAARRLGAALSAGVPPAAKAQWAEGFLSGGAGSSGSGLLLVHDRELLGVVDAWVASLGPAEFEGVLPLLRRTFGEFTAPERASIGRAVRSLGGAGFNAGSAAVVAGTDDLDAERARGAVRTVAAILGGGAIVEGAA